MCFALLNLGEEAMHSDPCCAMGSQLQNHAQSGIKGQGNVLFYMTS